MNRRSRPGGGCGPDGGPPPASASGSGRLACSGHPQEPHPVRDDNKHRELVDEHPTRHVDMAAEDAGEQPRHRQKRDDQVLAHVAKRCPRDCHRLTDAVDVAHESVDANPREGTTAAQNAIDWNDPKRVRPDKAEFTGQGVDRAVYGKVAD